MPKLTFNVLLSLIIDSKITGKGKIGNGRLLVEFLQTFADCNGTENTHERNLLKIFNDEPVKANSYHKIDRLVDRFLPQGKGYPYDKIRFGKFESSIGSIENYSDYLKRISYACDKILDKDKIDSLVYSLLEILRNDDSIDSVLYNARFIPKQELFGSYAHPKRICIEAFLPGLFYHTHKYPGECERIELLNIPKNLTFHVVRFKDTGSLDLDFPINLADNIRENARRQKTAEMKYRLEIRCGNEPISELPEKDNIFLYGTGGVGKSTLLMSRINNDNSVNFYFSLYRYKQEIHESLQPESCWILLQILLKYHYQYEYRTYEACAACESESVVLQQLEELKGLLKLAPIKSPKYTLLLDGINELPSGSREQLVDELSYIIGEWKNVRIIITGRTVPKYDIFDDFRQLDICGVSESERDSALSVLPDYTDILRNNGLTEILKTPLFLNMFLDSRETGETLNTRGEILDSYVMNIQSNLPHDSAVRFVVQYALPFAAKMMTDGFSYELDRGDLSEAIEMAFDTYLQNERIYQNYIAPKKFRKKNLLEIKNDIDLTELLIENICFLTASTQEPHKLCFTHQYFRDYFAAKYILNIAEALTVSYEYKHTDERNKLFKGFGLDMMWFYNEDDIYRLIGEISGDYKNRPCDDFVYHRTILDSILDMSRNIVTLRTAECVMKSMSLVRGGVLCDVDFSGTNLPIYIPCNIKFSYNGEYPCSFRESWVFSLSLYDTPVCCTAFSDDNKYLLIALENGYVIMWDSEEKRIVWDKDLSEYTEEALEFEYAFFSHKENVITLISCKSSLKINVMTGDMISCYNTKGNMFTDEYYECIDENNSQKCLLDEELKHEIFLQLTHFKNCDFSGAEFFVEEHTENLRKMGAIVD